MPLPATRRLGLHLLLALLVVNVAAVLWAERALSEQKFGALQTAEATTQNLARMLDQNITGSVEKIDLALLGVADELQRQLQQSGRFDDAQANRMLASYQQRLNGLVAYRVADAEGRVVLGSDVRADQPQTWVDRPYFAPLRDKPGAGLIVTKPITGRVSGIKQISFVHRINGPDGRFGGVVAASIPLAHFNQLLAALNLEPSGVAALRDADSA